MTDQNGIGVYLCSGCAIGQSIDVDALSGIAASEFKVPICKTHECLCGDEAVAMIAEDVASGGVEKPVIAACSPRVMTDRFQFDGAQVIRANMREQVVWCHPPGDEDTQMLANDQLRMAITRATKSNAPEPWKEGEFSDKILVVGGGYVGLSAALEASRAGTDVLLVERSDQLGGNVRRWSKVLPDSPPYGTPRDNPVPGLIAAVEGDARISVMTDAIVAQTSGQPGQFKVEITNGGSTSEEMVGAIVLATGWRPYDPNKLGHLGYGASPDVVTNVELEEMLAAGKVAKKNVAFIQCAGSRDPDHLPYCSSVCCGVSIKHALQLIEADPDVMAYVIFQELRTPGVAEDLYRAAQDAGVIFMKGDVKSVGADLTVVVDDALLGEEVPLQGLDMVVLATGMVPNSTNIDLPTRELGEDEEMPPLLRSDIDTTAPITVAGYMGEEPAAVEKREETMPEGGPLLNLKYHQGPHLPMLADGFPDSHFICFPYESRRTGIYPCGPLRRPMDMGEAGLDAAGAVLKAIQTIRLVRDGASVHPRSGDLSYPKIGLEPCTKCRRCTIECPFGAIDETDKDYPVVNPARCRRCGTCMGACPVRTISFDNYSIDMLTSMAKSCEIPDEFDEKPRVLILACENDAYPALDMAGLSRRNYSAFVRIIPVNCLGSVSALNVSDALSVGYDGIILMGCKSGDNYQCHFVKGSAMAQERAANIEETLASMMLEKERVEAMEVEISDAERVGQLIDDFVATIDEIGFNPFKGF
ncbi:MAG: FAD-dependent oxidoreductase [Rhodospirillales bacterium]|nr:FAD-dependent oxidoreductase [Rhodospirillales bacterium]